MRNIEILKGLLPGSKRKRMAMLMTMDILIACVSGYLALLARFDFSPSKIDPQYLTHWWELLPVFIAIVLTEYVCGQMYAIMWSQAGMSYLDIIPELR